MMTMSNFRWKYFIMRTFKYYKIFLIFLVSYLKLRKDVLSLIELVKRTPFGPSISDAFYYLRFFNIKNRKIWLFSVVLKSYIKN